MVETKTLKELRTEIGSFPFKARLKTAESISIAYTFVAETPKGNYVCFYEESGRGEIAFVCPPDLKLWLTESE